MKPLQPWSAGRCKSNIRIIVKPRLNRGCKICVTVFWCCFWRKEKSTQIFLFLIHRYPHRVSFMCPKKGRECPEGCTCHIPRILRCRSLDHAMQQCRASKKMNPHPIEYKPLIKSDPFFCKSWYFNLILIMAYQHTPHDVPSPPQKKKGS